MDLIIYCIILFLLGCYRVGATKNVDESVGIIQQGVEQTDYDNLPYGENLALVRDYKAFTLILEELGLM